MGGHVEGADAAQGDGQVMDLCENERSDELEWEGGAGFN